MNTKIKHRNDDNIDWSSTKNEPFPFTTAPHSFHQEWNTIEGEKVVNYRIVTCPVCQHAQKIDEKKLFRDVLQIRCPWCNQTFSWDFSIHVGAQYYVENIE